MLKAAVKNKQVEKNRELSEEEIISVISTLSKQRRESIELFLKGGREDLADKEKQEISILQSYLPDQLTPEELDRLIIEAIQESSAEGVKDIGQVMRLLMPRVKGAADGKVVNQRVKELLEKI
jgi:uncharacterized protein YqeY